MTIEPLDNPLAVDPNPSLDAFLQKNDRFSIYTHSVKTRALVLGLFISYLVFFTLFLDFVRTKIDKVEDLPDFLAAAADLQDSRWVYYTVAVIGVLLVLAIFFYFLWALLDIWGLQVWCSRVELRVQNTILGNLLAKWTGVGTLKMDDITALRGSRLVTRVYAGKKQVKFSPVEQVEPLIAKILSQAPGARVLD